MAAVRRALVNITYIIRTTGNAEENGAVDIPRSPIPAVDQLEPSTRSNAAAGFRGMVTLKRRSVIL